MLSRNLQTFGMFLFFFREVVEMILEKGFDINVRTSRGTALHEAAICGKVGAAPDVLTQPIHSQPYHLTSRWTW